MKNCEVIFIVEGIHCPNCVAALEKVMKDVAGIYKINVSEDFKQVHIIYNPDAVSTAELKEKIESTPNKEFKVIFY